MIVGRFLAQLLRFAWLEARSCLFAVGVFALLALSSVVPLPVARYDALLLGCLALTVVLWLTGVETGREVLVISVFHVVGLALELFKIRMGSWSYPEPALSKVAGVPLYSGFMYAAVGSYICAAWRHLDLRLVNYRPVLTALAAAAVYLNFFTHHWLPDLRLLAAAGLVAATWRTWVYYTVGEAEYRMPLALSFGLIGTFLWIAENTATFLGAWRYPDQVDVWRMVHLSKLTSWTLLVSVSFVLAAAIRRPAPPNRGDLAVVSASNRGEPREKACTTARSTQGWADDAGGAGGVQTGTRGRSGTGDVRAARAPQAAAPLRSAPGGGRGAPVVGGAPGPAR